MKKKIIIWISILAILIAGGALLFTRNNAEYVSAPDKQKVEQAVSLLGSVIDAGTMYNDWIGSKGDLNALYGAGEYEASPSADVIDYRETATYHVKVDKAGLYNLALSYIPVGNTMSDFAVNVEINNNQPYHEMKIVALPLMWTDETKDYATDSYGDEMAPRQVRNNDWQTRYLYSNTYASDEPMLFELEAGDNEIVLTNVAADGLGLGNLKVERPADYRPTYSEYITNYGSKTNTSNNLITINAIDYTTKNSTQAIYKTEADPVAKPYTVENKKLNALTFTEAGTELVYELQIPEDGLYELGFHYKNEKEEFDAFESIYVDGQIPFEELRSYAFAPTGSTWANEVLSDKDGNPYKVFLSAGTHVITIKNELENVMEAWNCARIISEHVSWFSLEIKKITGADKDKYRTWKMTKYIPEIADYLEAYETLINHIRYLTQDYTTYGINSALLSDMDKALLFIEQMAEYPDEIALYTEKLTGRDNSVLVSMSNFTSKILTTNFTLEMIYVNAGEKLPKATASAFTKIGDSFKKLTLSFTDNKYSTKADDDTMTIWVNRAVTHVDLLQKMIDTEFTPKSGVKVKVSIMPDANKLTMSAAADETPDIALGLTSYMPFDLACRDALYDLTQFPDFWQVADRFIPGAFVPYLYNEGVYALPETLDFHALVYRTDVYESLGLTPPNTWQDVIEQLPELQRYGMNFYHNIASGVGYKWFYQTVPLIYQNNGKLYNDDGLSAAIDQPNAVKGIQALGNLFLAYSLDKQVNSFFNSFRYSILPVGIIDSNEYILLKNGAPELEGQWALAAYPGTTQDDGNVTRWYVANGTGGIIFKDSKFVNEAWEFLKWWTEKETQVNYTYTLRSTYGKQFFWMSSNVEAVTEAPIDRADKDVILEQIQWLRDVPRTPGQYLLERSLSDIWNEMINKGTSAQVVIDEKTIPINREIKKKMQELKYMDEEGNLLKSYVIHDVDWIEEQIKAAKK